MESWVVYAYSERMRLLLGSGGFRSAERRACLHAEMRDFFGESLGQLLFIPYALHDYDAYLTAMVEQGFAGGYDLRGIHTFADPRHAIEEAEAVYVGGGNTFRLLHTMQELDLLKPLAEKVQAGMPYMGVSAGTNLACPTIMTTNDMPIVAPDGFGSLGLIPFQINAHFFSGQVWVKEGDSYLEHFGETREDRIREYHEMNGLPVLGLKEGAFLRVEDDVWTLKHGDAVLFQPGEEKREFSEEFDMTEVLS